MFLPSWIFCSLCYIRSPTACYHFLVFTLCLSLLCHLRSFVWWLLYCVALPHASCPSVFHLSPHFFLHFSFLQIFLFVFAYQSRRALTFHHYFFPFFFLVCFFSHLIILSSKIPVSSHQFCSFISSSMHFCLACLFILSFCSSRTQHGIILLLPGPIARPLPLFHLRSLAFPFHLSSSRTSIRRFCLLFFLRH